MLAVLPHRPNPVRYWIILIWLASGYGAGLRGSEPDGVGFFERKIRPILVEHCYACHSEQAQQTHQLKGGLRLDTRDGGLAGGDSGPAIIPHQAAESRIIQALRHDGLEMPPDQKLSAQIISDFVTWIELGAPDPRNSSASSSSPTPAAAASPATPLWSLQPLTNSRLPAVQRSNWPRRRLDYFILAQLEARGLSPAPVASDRELLRRLSFDLRGLPPTSDLPLASTLERPSPVISDQGDLYERWVDRYLSYPELGERWGRVWLDLARYADETEDWMKFQGASFAYRDWVIRAQNQDLPYNQFATLQLAADLVPAGDPRDRAALGFLGLGPQYWKELKLAPEIIRKIVADEWDERVDVVTSTFLGLTVACARCHDHKFDPITMQDYYALAGVFASTQAADQPLIPPTEYDQITHVRTSIAELQRQLTELRKSAETTPPQSTVSPAERIAQIEQQIAALERSVPDLHQVIAVAGVRDAAVHVLPDGPDQTKLEYHPGESLDLAVFIRGNPENRGAIVPRRFLTALSPASSPAFGAGSGRLDLADALFRDAAPLAARVIVNRVWLEHFGRGLVETPSNFGFQGDLPSHPALLDDLAREFMAHGWSLKWLHREIVTSATYRQSSLASAEQLAADPDNRLYGHMNRRRLPIESWRDAILTVSQELVHHMGGPSDAWDTRQPRRTIYGTVRRTELHELLRLHDFPTAEAHSPRRLPTTTPLQQLFVMNSPFIQHQATAFAARLQRDLAETSTVADRIRAAYAMALGRLPTARELALGQDYLNSSENRIPSHEAWSSYLQVILGGNEFLYVD